MKNLDKVEKYISLFVVSLYFIAGGYLLFCHRCITMMHREFRIVFALILILYGAYRLARILLIKKSDDDDEDEVGDDE